MNLVVRMGAAGAVNRTADAPAKFEEHGACHGHAEAQECANLCVRIRFIFSGQA